MIESIYICDRCGKKVKRAFDIKMGLSSPKDLCAKCYEELKNGCEKYKKLYYWMWKYDKSMPQVRENKT